MKKSNSFTAPLTTPEKTGGWFYFVFMLLALPFLIRAGFQLAGLKGTLFGINMAYYGINFLAVVLIFHKFLWENMKNIGESGIRFLTAVLLGFLGYEVLAKVLGFLYTILFPEFSNINDGTIASMADHHFFAMAVGTVILVPMTEECLYRGLMFRGFYEKNPVFAWICSMVAFSAVHVIGYAGTVSNLTLLLCFVQYLPAGFCLAWAYRFSNSIFAPMLIHAAVNLLGMLALR